MRQFGRPDDGAADQQREREARRQQRADGAQHHGDLGAARRVTLAQRRVQLFGGRVAQRVHAVDGLRRGLEIVGRCVLQRLRLHDLLAGELGRAFERGARLLQRRLQAGLDGGVLLEGLLQADAQFAHAHAGPLGQAGHFGALLGRGGHAHQQRRATRTGLAQHFGQARHLLQRADDEKVGGLLRVRGQAEVVGHPVVELDEAGDHLGVAREALRGRETARADGLRQRLPLLAAALPVGADARIADPTAHHRIEGLHRLLQLGRARLALRLRVGLAAQHGGRHAAVDLRQAHHLQQSVRGRQPGAFGGDGVQVGQRVAHVGGERHGNQQRGDGAEQHELAGQAQVLDEGSHWGGVRSCRGRGPCAALAAIGPVCPAYRRLARRIERCAPHSPKRRAFARRWCANCAATVQAPSAGATPARRARDQNVPG